MEGLFSFWHYSDGNPDKISNLLAGLIIDDYIKEDHNTIIHSSVTVKNQVSTIMGEIKCSGTTDTGKLVTEFCEKIGYNLEKYRFSTKHPTHINFLDSTHNQETINDFNELKVFGFACNETEELLPLGSVISKTIKDEFKKFDGIHPDFRVCTNVIYKDSKLEKIDNIIIYYNDLDSNIDTSKFNFCEGLFSDRCKEFEEYFNDDTKVEFIKMKGCGPDRFVGTSGTIDLCEAYGPFNNENVTINGRSINTPHRTLTYIARSISKHIVSASFLNVDKCSTTLNYRPDKEEPEIGFNFYGKKPLINVKWIESLIRDLFELDKSSVIRKFNKVNHYDLADSSHFFNKNYEWEKLTKLKEFIPL